MRNYVVKFMKLKSGLASFGSYFSYLINNNHVNHTKDGHKIVNFYDVETAKNKYLNMKNKILEEFEKWEEKKGPKGRPPNKYAQSITIDLPFHFKNEKDAQTALVRTLNKFLIETNKREGWGLTKEELKSYRDRMTFYNIHTQPNGSKTQFNILLSPYIKDDKKVDWTKKAFSTTLKIINTKVLKDFGFDPKTYRRTDLDFHIQNVFNKAVETNPNVNTQTFYKQVRQEITRKHLDNEQKAIEEEKQSLNRLKDTLNDLKSKLEESVEEVSKTVSTYLKRVEKGIEEENYYKVDKNLTLIDKNLSKNGIEVEGVKEMLEDIRKKKDRPGM
jgi:archaellum component FlaC